MATWRARAYKVRIRLLRYPDAFLTFLPRNELAGDPRVALFLCPPRVPVRGVVGRGSRRCRARFFAAETMVVER
ncbi:hypothetical protein DMO17_09015 [Aquipseudomonas alcaligenes]|uniref:Uncharacterized protein n=1 Tax=Aquipseudomonas alcaligenes TaxID=43263 RepID=A0A2V4LLW8_AQUAC|nr:hypothetical protein DMO17_09015 [Pseudomonas alcaligenes]